MTVLIDDDVRRKLDERAGENDRSLGWVVRQALAKYLEEN